MSHLLWYGSASVLKSVQSDLKLISPFHFFFPSFFGKRENNFSISFFRRIEKKKNPTILLPKIAYRISKSDLFPNIAELMVVMGCVTF